MHLTPPKLELYPDLVFRYGISWYFLGIFLTHTEGKLGKDLRYRTFGGTPFLLISAPFLMDQATLLKGVPTKFHKMELLPNLTVQKIPYIPYQRYQPTSAGNLPIPAKLPVNRWDTTLSKTKHLLCVGWRNFFSSCAVVSVFCSGGK